MGYDVNDDPYVDPATGILKNRLGIISQAELDKAEAEITTIVIATLTTGSDVYRLRFDRQLLQDLHKEIFGDIYDWAGEFRTLDISKESSYFAHAQYISPQLDALFEVLGRDERLSSDEKVLVVESLAHYYSELNAVHPFREGNGRVIRTLLRLLALKHGWDIEWNGLDQNLNIQACEAAMLGDEVPLRDILSPLVKRLE